MRNRVPPLYYLFYDGDGKLREEIGNAALVAAAGILLLVLLIAVFG